jgi:soluble lytic murein transglycosylase
MREYQNELELVIASYNAGATPVARWRAQEGFSDAQVFSERIPFAETREYVKILVRNMKMYELLYNVSTRRSFTT